MVALYILVGLVLGGAGGFFAAQKMAVRKGEGILEKAMQEAEAIKRDKMLQAKERFLEGAYVYGLVTAAFGLGAFFCLAMINPYVLACI